MINFLINLVRSSTIVKHIAPLTFASGLTIEEVKSGLEKNTHCGKYWNCKAKFDPKTCVVSIQMLGNERWEVDMHTGKGTRHDWDGDGCSPDHSFEFVMTKTDTGLKVTKTKYFG